MTLPDSDGGGASSGNDPVHGSPEAPPPSPTPEPPPAAAVVLGGNKSERELQLAKELDQERAARKKVELDNAQLQDEVHRLTAPAPAASTSAGPGDDAAPTARPRAARRRGPLGVRIR